MLNLQFAVLLVKIRLVTRKGTLGVLEIPLVGPIVVQ